MAVVRLRGVTLGEGPVKVIVPLTGRTDDDLDAAASALAGLEFDVVEWRVDFFDRSLDPDAVLAAARRLRAALGERPLLFTFRTAAEGGRRAVEPDAYAALNIAALRSGLVDAVDVEHLFDGRAGDAVLRAARSAGVPVVLSSHDVVATPPAEEIVGRLVAMQARGAAVAKMAVMPADAGDVLALLEATWAMASRHPQTPVITMAMGGRGLVSRLAAQVFGSCATFASVGEASAPGQVPLERLRPVLDLVDAAL